MIDPNEKIIEGNVSPPKIRIRRRKEIKTEPVEIKEEEFINLEENKKMKKTIIITAVVSLIVGVILTIVGYFVYVVVRMQTQVNQNTTTLIQIVDFINKANAQTATTKTD